MFTPRTTLQRLIFPIIFITAILASGCSDDDPTGPSIPGVDISGVVRNQNGGPGSGATVFLGRNPVYFPRPATIVFDSVLADDLGSYYFDELDEGSYLVYAGIWDRGGDGFSLVTPFSRRLNIAAKSAGHVANLALHEMADDGVVEGQIFHDDGLGETPADSTNVALYRYEGADFVMVDETATTADGRFTLEEVETGNYTVTADKVLNPGAQFPLLVFAESETFFCNGEDPILLDRLILTDLMVEKPAIYIYPEQAGRFQVDLEFGQGIRLTASEPDYGGGWDVFVDESGRIDGTWDYLFYEIAMPGAPLITQGWCLSWSELPAGLESITAELGLNAAERDDFLDYWMSRLPRQNYYQIHPVFGNDLADWVRLDVTPVPDTVLRFWLFFKGNDTAAELTAPGIHDIERSGTTVVEWGGVVIP